MSMPVMRLSTTTWLVIGAWLVTRTTRYVICLRRLTSTPIIVTWLPENVLPVMVMVESLSVNIQNSIIFGNTAGGATDARHVAAQ